MFGVEGGDGNDSTDALPRLGQRQGQADQPVPAPVQREVEGVEKGPAFGDHRAELLDHQVAIARRLDRVDGLSGHVAAIGRDDLGADQGESGKPAGRPIRRSD